jgi:hypothetical protein
MNAKRLPEIAAYVEGCEAVSDAEARARAAAHSIPMCDLSSTQGIQLIAREIAAAERRGAEQMRDACRKNALLRLEFSVRHA